jgi:hypothetical protein
MMAKHKTGAKKNFLHNPADSLSISSNIGGFIKQRPDGQLWIGTLMEQTFLIHKQAGLQDIL